LSFFVCFLQQKKISVVLLFFSILAGFLLAGVVSATGTELITAFGDSITEGHCRGVCNGYFEVLSSMMTSSGRPVEIINGGLGGEVTRDGVGRINIFLTKLDYTINNHCSAQTQFNGRKGHIILIMEGANDAIHGISWQTTRQNLQYMLDKSKAAGVVPVLATVTPDYIFNMMNCNGGILGSYNSAIRSLASSEGIALADQCTATNSDWNNLTCEGLHPTYAGDVRLSKTWYSVMPPVACSLGGALHLLLRH